MNVMISLLFFALIIGVIFLICLLVQRKAFRSPSKKGIYITLAVYVGLLLLSPAVFSFTKEERVMAWEKFDQTSYHQEGEKLQTYRDLVLEGQFDQINSEDIDYQWSYSFEGDTLSIVRTGDYYYYEELFIEKKRENDGVVEVSLIKGPSLVFDYEISEFSPTSQFELESNRLIWATPQEEWYVQLFEPEFPIQQFQNHSLREPYSGVIYHDILHIAVPENVEIEINEEELYHQLINF
ncbi:hypothetical protein BTS2_2328 [Bacillus sp. TS-2]|nr:hypothetical protein BTS2_2328 [Bacillus sp. TS-2]